MQAEEERLQAAADDAASAARRTRIMSFSGRQMRTCSTEDIDSPCSELADNDQRMGYSRRNTTMVVKGARNALVEWKRRNRRAISILDCGSVKSADCVLILDCNDRGRDINQQKKQVKVFLLDSRYTS